MHEGEEVFVCPYCTCSTNKQDFGTEYYILNDVVDSYKTLLWMAMKYKIYN